MVFVLFFFSFLEYFNFLIFLTGHGRRLVLLHSDDEGSCGGADDGFSSIMTQSFDGSTIRSEKLNI